MTSLWILQSPAQLPSELVEKADIRAAKAAGTKPGCCSAFTPTHTQTLTGVSLLTRDEFVGLWCAQVCWLSVSPYKGVLTRRVVFLWSPLHQGRGHPRLILSDALLVAIGKTIKRTLADKREALSDVSNKAHLYWPLSDLYEC